MLDHSCQTQRHPHSERGLDPYFTPAKQAIPPLLAVETVPRVILEPGAGRGDIASELRATGRRVITSDIADYGFPLDYQQDFLTTTAMPPGCECILTNPPFRWVEEFIEHSLKLSPLVIMLLRLAFFEAGSGKQRKHILRRYVLDEVPPARIHVFRRRLPMMHRDTWTGKQSNSGMAFAWWVWDANHVGPTTIDRISWEV
jgi:hypothetical protein